MRKLMLAAFVAFIAMSLYAQDNSNNYQDIYQQYLNNQQPAQPAQPAQEEKKEEAPAPQPAAQPAQPAQEEKKEEAKEEEKKEEPAQEQPAEQAQPAEEQPQEAAPAEEKPAEPGNIPGLARKPYFLVAAYGGVSNGINWFGNDALNKSSYRFGMDDAILDLQGGDRMFNGRIVLNFAKGLVTEKSIDINYEHDDTLPTDYTNPLELEKNGDAPNALDVLENVSFRFEHPSFRNANNTFGLNVNLEVGLFSMPFGIESGYNHEIIFSNSPIKNNFLGGGFNELGLSFGLDFLFASDMDLAFNIFAFNGHNEVMLDGSDKFADPAFGFDLRFRYDKKFFATAAFSLIVGSAYHAYDEETENGIFNTVNNTYLDEKNKIEENLVLKDDATGRNDFERNKKNIILSIGTDLGYHINDKVTLGLLAEFVYSNRAIFNPKANIFVDGKYYEGVRFLRDGSNGTIWNGNTYDTWGVFGGLYGNVYWFDILARVSYYKAPYLFTYVKDSDNSVLGFDFEFNYNFCDYAAVGLAYSFAKEDIYKFDSAIDAKNYFKNTYYHQSLSLAFTFYYDHLWEEAGK
ncbi:hypothetical protein J6Z39_04260 [bacterium]|nr:hypothetical protein [bacterium]